MRPISIEMKTGLGYIAFIIIAVVVSALSPPAPPPPPPPVAPPQPAVPGEPEWKFIAAFSGHGSKLTDSFTVMESKFRVAYSYTAISPYSVFAFYVYPVGDAIPTAEILERGKASNSDSITIFKSGSFLIRVRAEGLLSWSLTLEES